MSTSTFNLLISELTALVNTSQYFNPFFSWMIVTYTYFSIGRHGGKIWKYLFYFVSCALIAITIKAVQTISKSFEVDHVKFLNLLWLENIFWGINEWGYLFINFVKIKTIVSQLNRKIWDIILYSLLVYTIVIRMIITYREIEGKKPGYISQNFTKLPPDNNYNGRLNSALYFPLGILCTLFIYLIIKNFHTEKNTDKKGILFILLHSTLSRMLFVSLIFIGMSVIVFFNNEQFIRTLLWRIKGNLGIVFLVDLLLLRIDLDKNKLLEQGRQIKMNDFENLYNRNDLNPSRSSPGQQNNNMNMEYTNKLFSENENTNDFGKRHSHNKKNKNEVKNFYVIENSDDSRNSNYNYTTNYPRSNRKNSRVSNISSSFKSSTPHLYTNFSNDTLYNVSPQKLPYNTNISGIDSISTSPYDSMSRLHSGTIVVDTINPPTISTSNESTPRSFSQKSPQESSQDTLTLPQSGKMHKDPYHGFINYSFPDNEYNELNENMTNRHLGDIGMENLLYKK